MNTEVGTEERGRARIQQLMEQFPEMPRQMILKAEVILRGVRHTPAMDEVGRWAVPDDHHTFEHDREEHSQGDFGGAYTLTPQFFFFRNGTAARVMFDPTSPYEVKYEGRGCYWLYRDDEPIEEVRFEPCPQWFRQRTSSGKPMASIMAILGTRRGLVLSMTSYCSYFTEGDECLFCNRNPAIKHLKEMGQERTITKREQDIYETYMAAAQETGVDSIAVLGGSFVKRKKGVDLCIEGINVVKRAMRDSGCEVPITAGGFQCVDEEDLIRVKKAGAVGIGAPLEVWDPKLFEIICPGKAKHVGRDAWIKYLLMAVDVFGRGYVVSNFVLGGEMVPPFGFKTEDEAAESVLEGFHYLISHGVVPKYLPFRNAPRSRLADAFASIPRIEYVLRIEEALHELLKKYDLREVLRGGGNQPNVTYPTNVNREDWIDVPKEDIWPPALR